MTIHVVQVPYDSGYRAKRMGLSTLTGRCWQALASTVPGFHAVPDKCVLLVGGHGADQGALSVLADSHITHAPTRDIAARGPASALTPRLDDLARQGVTRIYLHLDVDVLDAAHAPANQFAPKNGLSPDRLMACVGMVTERFEVAGAAVASYDPDFDIGGRVRDAAFGFLEAVAAARPSVSPRVATTLDPPSASPASTPC